MKKVILFWFLLTAAIYLAFAFGADEKEVSNNSGMKDLTSLEILKQDFNVHRDKVRIVTLLSPT